MEIISAITSMEITPLEITGPIIIALIFAIVFIIFVIYAIIKGQKRKLATGKEDMIGKVAITSKHPPEQLLLHSVFELLL